MHEQSSPSLSFDNDKVTAMTTPPPIWGSYLYQNFLVPAFSPTSTVNAPTATDNANVNASLPAAAPATTFDWLSNDTPQSQDFFGLSAWQDIDITSKTELIPEVHGHHGSIDPLVKLEPVDDSFGTTNVQRTLSLDSLQIQLQQQQPQQQYRQSPNQYSQPFYYHTPAVINTSLLTQSLPPTAPAPLPLPEQSSKAQSHSSESINIIDSDIAHSDTHSLSPLSSHVVSPNESPILRTRAKIPRRGIKRSHSIESDYSHSHDEHDHEFHEPEGVERDGMIWGMKVEDYRALSARERKRVRNRISARTFRAKRKEHLSSLEHTLGAKDLAIKLAHEETARLRREVGELKKKLAKYEKPYDRPT